MPSVYDLKPAFQRSLRPLMNALVRARVTPNQITLAALLLSFAGGGLLVWQDWSYTAPWVLLALPVILLARMALNALDGMLARTQDLSSPLGEILNELGDVLADIALYLPLALFAWDGWAVYTVVGFVLLAVLTEFCGLLGKTLGGKRRYDGPMGKSDRAFAIALYALALYFSPLPASDYTGPLFLGLDFMLVLTCLNRLRGALSEARAS